MPPSHVKTIRELIYWEYAQLIAEAAVSRRKNYGFVTHSYKRLKSGKMNPSDILRENKMLVDEKTRANSVNLYKLYRI